MPDALGPTVLEITDYPAVVAALTEDVVVEFFRAFAAIDRWDAVNAIWKDFDGFDSNDLRQVRKNWVICYERAITLKMFADAIHKMSSALDRARIAKPQPQWTVLDATRVRLNAEPHRRVRDRVAAHMDPEPMRDALRTREKEVGGPLPVVRLAPGHLPFHGLVGVTAQSVMNPDEFDIYLEEAEIGIDVRSAVWHMFFELMVAEFPDPALRPFRFREISAEDLFRLDVTGFFAGGPR